MSDASLFGRNKFLRAVLLLCCLAPTQARADDTTVGGHLKYQFSDIEYGRDDLQALIGPRNTQLQTLDARIKYEEGWQSWRLETHAELVGAMGDELPLRRQVAQRLAASASWQSDRRRLFDLSPQVLDQEHALLETRLDRLNISYSNQDFVARLGRQAITWGNGLIFQVLDPFNPFSPTEIDKDYKSGDDMLYSQYAFANGSEAQMLLIPRRDLVRHEVEWSESSLAGKYHGTVRAFDYDLVLAQHYAEKLFGLGLSRSLLEAVIRCDVALNEVSDGGFVPSWILNLDRSFVVRGKNVYLSLEYYHNGLGAQAGDYLSPNVNLTDRISRGEIFTVGKNYAAIALRVEWTPRINIYLNQISNLHDPSGITQLRTVFDLSQDLALNIGVDLPWGVGDSEFGGIELPDGHRIGVGARAYARLSYYF